MYFANSENSRREHCVCGGMNETSSEQVRVRVEDGKNLKEFISRVLYRERRNSHLLRTHCVLSSWMGLIPFNNSAGVSGTGGIDKETEFMCLSVFR